MEKQRLLYQQSRLHNRGAAEMVLQMISACKGSLAPIVLGQHFVFLHNLNLLSSSIIGETGPMVTTTLQLGISILNGGNSEVQRVCVLNFSKRNPLDYDIMTLNLLLEPLFLLYSFFFRKCLNT